MHDNIPPTVPQSSNNGVSRSRHVEAANWMRLLNRRLRDDVLLPQWALEKQVAGLSSALNEARNHIAAYENSTSWRMTAPLRWLMGYLISLRRTKLIPQTI